MIAITPEEIKRVGGEIVGSSNEFQNCIKEIYNLVSQMLESHEFAGEAATKYGNQFFLDRTRFEKFGEELNNYGLTLQKVGDSFNQLDEGLASQISGHRG